MHFKTSSAISFNLDQSKILLSGNGLKSSLAWVTKTQDGWLRLKYYCQILVITSVVVVRNLRNVTRKYKAKTTLIGIKLTDNDQIKFLIYLIHPDTGHYLCGSGQELKKCY